MAKGLKRFQDFTSGNDYSDDYLAQKRIREKHREYSKTKKVNHRDDDEYDEKHLHKFK